MPTLFVNRMHDQNEHSFDIPVHAMKSRMFSELESAQNPPQPNFQIRIIQPFTIANRTGGPVH
ncbi:hypothetical protein [Bifidobacterium vespertilionis]|uniref:Uncharacterized protein n=1 Tax=Bifidobacterium vespertilionis TaxID=2562524 RepID=A0A5J5E4D1_9BIFI|nr:hypothetical protein [Bifidobacterium vespertilionis]KAA8817032.1 hypothetical protein EMO90_10920 [Bifidobacterium vespertilionis]KAA8823804.1 hypothetical protein EM848_04545 [Bifidobacterium vespertilionis]